MAKFTAGAVENGKEVTDPRRVAKILEELVPSLTVRYAGKEAVTNYELYEIEDPNGELWRNVGATQDLYGPEHLNAWVQEH